MPNLKNHNQSQDINNVTKENIKEKDLKQDNNSFKKDDKNMNPESEKKSVEVKSEKVKKRVNSKNKKSDSVTNVDLKKSDNLQKSDNSSDQKEENKETEDNSIKTNGSLKDDKSNEIEDLEDEDIIVIDENNDVKETTPKHANKSIENWVPKTQLGKDVLNGKITNIDEILNSGKKILESEIVDALLPNLSSELLLIGQSKGKFGGGKRRVFKQTQKKTREGNKIQFGVLTIVGDENGHIGLGRGKAKETVPAREKSLRRAKLNLISIVRGCGSWACGCGTPHSVPFKVIGKQGSVVIEILPAPKGKGLVGEPDVVKLLKMAGIKDAWVKIKSGSQTRLNMILACFNALKSLSLIKVKESYIKESGLIKGSIPSNNLNNKKVEVID